MSGYIKVHRKIWNHPKSTDHQFMSVWLWMLCRASYEEREEYFDGRTIILKPGQFTAGRKQVSRETGVSEQRIRTIWKWLINNQQINQQTTKQCSLFTVLNWDRYQMGNQGANQQSTNDQPTTNQQSTTLKEVKKERRKEKDILLEKEFDEHWGNIRKSASHKSRANRGPALRKWIELRGRFSVEEILHWWFKVQVAEKCDQVPGFDVGKNWEDTDAIKGAYAEASPAAAHNAPSEEEYLKQRMAEYRRIYKTEDLGEREPVLIEASRNEWRTKYGVK